MPLGDFWRRLGPLLSQPTLVQPSPTVPIPSTQPTVPQPTTHREGPEDLSTVMGRIRAAGTKLLLLSMRYKGKNRYVEPYSMKGNLFYGFCSLHARIHSFRVERIESIQVTDQHYTPRWPVEL